jgi:hypothetical protein
LQTRYSGETGTEKNVKGKKTVVSDALTITGNFAPGQIGGGRHISGGRNALKQMIGSTIPTITFGTNGTMVTSAQLSSNANGLLGTINMQGGSFKSKSTVAPNGLSMEENNLPVRMIPAKLSLVSMGCPIAELYQKYFVDFDTGTTLDNLYNVTSVAHTINQGKFSTSWQLSYDDGYGRFYGAQKLTNYIKEFNKTLPEQPPEAKSPLK